MSDVSLVNMAPVMNPGKAVSVLGASFPKPAGSLDQEEIVAETSVCLRQSILQNSFKGNPWL